MKKLRLLIPICFLAFIIFSCQSTPDVQPPTGFSGEILTNVAVELPSPYNPESPEKWTTTQSQQPEAVFSWENKDSNHSLTIEAPEPLQEINNWFQRTQAPKLAAGSVIHLSVDADVSEMDGTGVMIQIEGLGRTTETIIQHGMDGGNSCGSRNQESTKVIQPLEFTESFLIKSDGASKTSGFQTYDISFILPDDAHKVKSIHVSLNMLPETQGKVKFDNISCFVSLN